MTHIYINMIEDNFAKLVGINKVEVVYICMYTMKKDVFSLIQSHATWKGSENSTLMFVFDS